jgi:hypothetical protein
MWQETQQTRNPNDWLTECQGQTAEIRVRLACGCAEEVLPLWEGENPGDGRMASVVRTISCWAHRPSIDSLLAMYDLERRVSAFKPGWDLSPVDGMFPETLGSTSAGDYAGDCIVWAGRAVTQYHVGMLWRTPTRFGESADHALENAVEAVARSRENGWSDDGADNCRGAQEFLTTRLAGMAHDDASPFRPEVIAPEGRDGPLAELQ